MTSTLLFLPLSIPHLTNPPGCSLYHSLHKSPLDYPRYGTQQGGEDEPECEWKQARRRSREYHQTSDTCRLVIRNTRMKTRTRTRTRTSSPGDGFGASVWCFKSIWTGLWRNSMSIRPRGIVADTSYYLSEVVGTRGPWMMRQDPLKDTEGDNKNMLALGSDSLGHTYHQSHTDHQQLDSQRIKYGLQGQDIIQSTQATDSPNTLSASASSSASSSTSTSFKEKMSKRALFGLPSVFIRFKTKAKGTPHTLATPQQNPDTLDKILPNVQINNDVIIDGNGGSNNNTIGNLTVDTGDTAQPQQQKNRKRRISQIKDRLIAYGKRNADNQASRSNQVTNTRDMANPNVSTTAHPGPPIPNTTLDASSASPAPTLIPPTPVAVPFPASSSSSTPLVPTEYPLPSLLPSTHPLAQILAERRASGSKPGNRADKYKVALAIEGGGMRSAVTAGMAAAIKHLGLEETFDEIYGSSAGAIIGTYFISRQLPWYGSSIYFEEICNKKFVDKLALLPFRTSRPVLYLDLLLDEIMRHKKPLHWEKFWKNHQVQPLKPVATCADTLDRVVLDHFTNMDQLLEALRASARVPAIAGNPVKINDRTFTDALVSEPIPYKSAIENGATHVLVLRSKGSSIVIDSKKNLVEKSQSTAEFVEQENHDQQRKRRATFDLLKRATSKKNNENNDSKSQQSSIENNTRSSSAPHFATDISPFSSDSDSSLSSSPSVLSSSSSDIMPSPSLSKQEMVIRKQLTSKNPGIYEMFIAPRHLRASHPKMAAYMRNGGHNHVYVTDANALLQIQYEWLESHIRGSSDPDPLHGKSTPHIWQIEPPTNHKEIHVLETTPRTIYEGVRAGFQAAYDTLCDLVPDATASQKTGADIARSYYSEKKWEMVQKKLKRIEEEERKARKEKKGRKGK